MEYIKFKKDHSAGIKKGTVVVLKSRYVKKFIDEEYAEKSSKEEFNKYKESISDNRAKESKEKLKAVEAIEKKKEIKLNQKLYRAIDELDLEANDSLSDQGIKEGTMVEVDAKANIVFNEAGEVNLKDDPKKEAPKKKKAKKK